MWFCVCWFKKLFSIQTCTSYQDRSGVQNLIWLQEFASKIAIVYFLQFFFLCICLLTFLCVCMLRCNVAVVISLNKLYVQTDIEKIWYHHQYNEWSHRITVQLTRTRVDVFNYIADLLAYNDVHFALPCCRVLSFCTVFTAQGTVVHSVVLP